MAFRQHRPQPSRQLSIPPPELQAGAGATSSPLRKRSLEASEEWVLFSPAAPSTTARTHTTSTDRTPRTAGLSRYSDFGSLDTAARSEQDDDDVTQQGTEEGDLDSLDDGLHAFHEPSEYGAPTSRLQQSGDTVLPTHDGLGTFQPDATMQEHLWQFERQSPRRRHARRRSSVQRRLDSLDETEDVHQEQDRRQRIEKWRLDQSRALLEEIERETRRRRKMSVVSAGRNRPDGAHVEGSRTSASPAAQSVSDGQSVSSDENTENLSFWQRLTRRVIRDLMGIDEDTLSVIFGEALPEEVVSTPVAVPLTTPQSSELITTSFTSQGEPWEHRLLERIAKELGILVHQLSEHPGAFSTYRRTQDEPEYVGLSATEGTAASSDSPSPFTGSQPSMTSPKTPRYTPSYPIQQSSNAYSEASLWGIEEEPSVESLDSLRTLPNNVAEDLVREQEYWERELDVKMVFNFLVQRFSSRRSSTASHHGRGTANAPRRSSAAASTEAFSARRAAIIRQHHPLVTADRLPTSSSNVRDGRRRETLFRQHMSHQASVRGQALKSSSSCASHSTKKSKRSAGSNRNYWDLSGSVGSGSVIASEA